MRTKYYALRTEEAYVQWIRRFMLFYGKRHPKEMAEPEVERFLTHLAVQENAAASTQNQALSALLFLYRHVLKQPLNASIVAVRAKRSKHLPTVLTVEEVQRLLQSMIGTQQLVAKLLYGSGLRLTEGLCLRVNDIDFGQSQIIVRDDKGNRDRVTILPHSITPILQAHILQVKQIHQDDLAAGYGAVYLPDALERKYPQANREWIWQYVFPARKLSVDPHSGQTRRHHLSNSVLQKSVKQAAKRAQIDKKVGSHTLRHSFATHLLQNGYDIHIVQELMGHKDVKTTMVYTHVMNPGGLGVRSPLDA